MTRNTYETAQIAELVRPEGWAPIRLRLGVQAFGVNAWTAQEAGAPVVPEHGEEPSGHEELYLVTDGHAVFTVEGEEIDAPTGTIVFVRDPAAIRAAVAREAGTTVVCVGARPGEAYRPRSWEITRQVYPLLDEGKYADAKRVLVDALDRYEDRSVVLYNLACAEALLDEADAALEHLREAVDGRPSLAETAREDSDFAQIRDDPRFRDIVAASD